MYYYSLKTRKHPPPQQPRCFFLAILLKLFIWAILHNLPGFFGILLGLEFWNKLWWSRGLMSNSETINLNNPELLQVTETSHFLTKCGPHVSLFDDPRGLFRAPWLSEFKKLTSTAMPVSCNSIHRPIESIAVFKTASGPSGAACCFVQSSRGCIIKTLNFIEHAEKPIETWRVFPYIDFRMISLKMPYVSLGFKRFEIEVGSRGRSGKYLVFWNLKAVEPCSLAFLLSRASIIVLEFMLKQRLFLKQFSWSSFCQIAFASRSTISFNTVSYSFLEADDG